MALDDPAASIVRSMDGELAADLLRSVRDHELPPALRTLIAEYQSLEAARDPFIWKWAHRLAPTNMMPFVDETHEETIATTKTMLILFVTILDDLLEKHRDYETFAAIGDLVRTGGPNDPLGGTPNPTADIDGTYAALALRVWERIVDRLAGTAGFDRYAPLFRFDLAQIFTAIEYSTLAIERPELATVADLRRYEVHNIGMYSFLDVDLMHSPVDLIATLPDLREAVDAAQQMARIGNWLSTWEREVREGDVSSGVVVAALERGIISPEELPKPGAPSPEAAERVVERIRANDLEGLFLDEWNEQYWTLDALSRRVDAVDLDPFVDGTKEVLRYHLASRGFK